MVWDVVPSWRLESVTSRRKYRDHYLNDWNFSSLDIMHKETDSLTLSYSQEFRGSYTETKGLGVCPGDRQHLQGL